MEADGCFGGQHFEHDASAVLLGSAVRTYVANGTGTEVIDFVDERYMYRSWAVVYVSIEEWEDRYVTIPLAWECSVAGVRCPVDSEKSTGPDR